MSGAKNIGPQNSNTPVPTRLRQIALVTKNLDGARKLFTHVLGTEVIYKDPAVEQWGLRNFLIPLGGDIIEVVAPFQENTTAGRLLEKRGEGGYMIIMPTEDAKKRRAYIEAEGLSKVIFSHEHDDALCLQYDPKGVRGALGSTRYPPGSLLTTTSGMIPKLDSHTPGPNNSMPLTSRFSPWHPCGSDHNANLPSMERSCPLNLEGCVLRLQPGDLSHEAAARQWEELFVIVRSRDLLAFTNAGLGFVPGRAGQPEILVSIMVGVMGKDRFDAFLQRARDARIYENNGIEMCGIK